LLVQHETIATLKKQKVTPKPHYKQIIDPLSRPPASQFDSGKVLCTA